MSDSKLFSLFQEHNQAMEQSLALSADMLDPLASALSESFAQGQRLFLLGSGTLAPVAAAIAQSFSYQLNMERPSLPTVSLEPSAGVASALVAAEDYSRVYSGPLQALAQPGDQLVIFDSTADPAVIAAAQLAQDIGCAVTVFCTIDSAPWHDVAVSALAPIPEVPAGRAAEVLLFLGHALCQMVESELFGM
jgi:D-sedoheptulose 7-phosphate isomerase